jgi:hypothetical protein
MRSIILNRHSSSTDIDTEVPPENIFLAAKGTLDPYRIPCINYDMNGNGTACMNGWAAT